MQKGGQEAQLRHLIVLGDHLVQFGGVGPCAIGLGLVMGHCLPEGSADLRNRPGPPAVELDIWYHGCGKE
jgi:hypothetical protein